MNFFGHATIALVHASRDDARFVLGAMLPDFASMARLRVAGVEDLDVEAGIALHHRTDEAFHGAPTFLALMGEAQDELEEAGLGHGSAMAIAHVGVELLLDGELVARGGVPASYRAALETDHAPIRWRQADGDVRWDYLRARLRDAPVPDGYRDPDFVSERLIRILAGRPRLALRPEAVDTVYAWARRAHGPVADATDALMAEVAERMAR